MESIMYVPNPKLEKPSDRILKCHAYETYL